MDDSVFEEYKGCADINQLRMWMKERGQTIRRLERKLRRLKRKSARQHQVISAVKKYSRSGYVDNAVLTVGKAYTSAFGQIGAAVPYVPLDVEKKDENNS